MKTLLKNLLMIKTIILQPEYEKCDKIINLINTHCPKLSIDQVSNYRSFTLDAVSGDSDQIVLYDVPTFTDLDDTLIQKMGQKRCSNILISQKQEFKYWNSFKSLSGVINRPINEAEFAITVNNTADKLELEQKLKEIENNFVESFPRDIIGIPTMDGFEYVKIDSIVRCEGLQRCTRIVTSDRSDIISAYPIGRFKSLLRGNSFYLSHRSHLINLKKVIRYSREGYIFLNDSSKVPLARRNKTEFVAQWRHI